MPGRVVHRNLCRNPRRFHSLTLHPSLPFPSQAGIWPGLIGLVTIGFCSLVGVDLLVSTFRTLSATKNMQTFGDVGFHCYGRPGALLVDSLLILTQMGFCSGYFIFISESLEALIGLNADVWVLVAYPSIVVLSWLRSLKRLAPISFVGMIAVGTALVTVVIFAFLNMKEHRVKHDNMLLGTMPVAFGIVVAAFEGVGLVIPTMTSMRDSARYPELLRQAMYVIISAYCAVATVGYMSFGRETESIVTLNLPQHSWFVSLVELSMCFAILFTYPIQLHPVIEIAERSDFFARFEREGSFVPQKVLRSLLVSITAIVAVIVPNFALLIGLIGSAGSAAISFVLPGLFHLKVHKGNLTIRERLVDYAIILFGLVGGLVGTVQTISSMTKVDDE